MIHASSVILALLVACTADPPPPPTFVRDGVVLAGDGAGRVLPDGRRLVRHPWSPGETVSVAGNAIAPTTADCVPLFHVPLGDVARGIAAGGGAPDTALAFSPDGAWLAIGTQRGEVLVVDGWTGAVRWRRTLAESLVKQVAWSPDGTRLYAAEQSPDAFVHALDPTTGTTRHQLRLADHVQTSAPPPGDDLYGVYTLPAAYGLEVLADGDLVIAATHGWNDREGVRRNQARVLRTGPTLQIRSAWPADGAADAVILSMAAEADGVAVSLRRSAEGPAPEGLPIDGVLVLSAALEPRRAERFEPLEPWFHDTFVWHALALDGDRVVAGLGDGRVFDRAPGADRTHPLATPIEVGDGIPVVASIGFLAVADHRVHAVTNVTNIPWGSADPSLEPPDAHPGANTLWALDRDGESLALAWTWRGPHRLTGLHLDDRWVTVGAGARQDARTDLFGALVFDRTGAGSGAERLRAACRTEAPVFFRMDSADDGRVAVTEHPWADGDRVRGAYRATVFR